MVDSEGRSLDWPEIGMSLCIPRKAVPDCKMLYLEVWPCLSGPFVPPEGREFSSPVYLISPAFQFQENVELSIDHFESLLYEEDVASMSFATSPITPEICKSRPTYPFKLLEKGEFKIKSATGVIRLRHFCFSAATREGQDDASEAEQNSKT